MTQALPPLYALRAFEAAARTCSCTLAAAQLHLSQSAISKHIKTLEQHFGCRLLVRKGSGMVVTPQGQLLATELSQGLRQIEQACRLLQQEDGTLRLKAPSTLTVRWLLDCLSQFRNSQPGFEVQIASIWMDIDSVDFLSEPYDCAILLGSGRFGRGTQCVKLFDEWLTPICAPAAAKQGLPDLHLSPLIHPSPDRRDWRRWLQAVGRTDVDLMRGQVFDTLEQSNLAALAGHGIAIGDLALCADAIRKGQLATPFEVAVSTGDAYYLVWPEQGRKQARIRQLQDFLLPRSPDLALPGIRLLAGRPA